MPQNWDEKANNFIWPKDGSMETMISYRRYEDMSPDGYISLMVEEDGDVILMVQQGEVSGGLDNFHMATVQFCHAFGGGQSPNVRNALLHLIQAIQQDNKERPQNR